MPPGEGIYPQFQDGTAPLLAVFWFSFIMRSVRRKTLPILYRKVRTMFQCTFTGNLGKEPVYRMDEQTGEPYALMSVAVSRGKDQPALWVSVTLKGKKAETFAALEPHTGARLVVSVDYPPKLELYTRQDGKSEPVLKVRAAYVEVANFGGRRDA